MQGNEPLLVMVCDDLFFHPRIEDAARALGYRFKAITTNSDIGIEGDSVRREVHLSEPLEGPDATLIQFLVDERPALVFIDTAHQQIHWRNWIHVIKTSAATRRIPIIAFGSHVIREPLTEASEAGADLTVSRGRLQASLADLITEWASVLDEDEVRLACGDGLSDQAKAGIELIAEGKYYDAHEILETAWRNSHGAEGYLLRTLLQVSVTYLHIERGNLRGAMKMLLRLKNWISPLPEECQGVNVEALRAALSELRNAIAEDNLQGDAEDYHKFLMPIPMVEGR